MQRNYSRYHYLILHIKNVPSDVPTPAEMVCLPTPAEMDCNQSTGAQQTNFERMALKLHYIFASLSVKSTEPSNIFIFWVKETGQSAPVDLKYWKN